MDAILEYISRITLQEQVKIVVELLLIGIVVYWAVSFLEGTRGERLFRGVVFIFIIAALILKLVVENFELTRVELLFKDAALIALLILFIAPKYFKKLFSSNIKKYYKDKY